MQHTTTAKARGGEAFGTAGISSNLFFFFFFGGGGAIFALFIVLLLGFFYLIYLMALRENISHVICSSDGLTNLAFVNPEKNVHKICCLF